MKNEKIKIKTPKLQPYQLELYDNLVANWVDSIHVIKSPRQYGKSFLIEMLLLSSSVNHAKQVSIVLEPTLSQSRKMASELYNLIKDIPIFQSYNSTLLEIKFSNNSQIIFKSNEQGGDAIRGYTISKNGMLIIDEGAYCSDDTFYSAIPLCNAYKAPILIFSTPRWKSGFFYELYIKGEQGEKNIYSYDWSKFKNPFLTDEKLEMVKKTMSYNLFMADYRGIWMDNNSDVFGDFSAVLSNDVVMSGNYIASVDWGVGKNAKSNNSDYTAVSVFNELRQQVYCERWNDLNETQTIKRIGQILKQFKPKKTIVETNSIGSIYLGLLKKEILNNNILTQIVSINLSNRLKNEIYSEFIINVQNRTIQLLDDAEIKMEMSALQQQRTKSGLLTYNASAGYHDDYLDTIAYCIWGMKQSKYIII